MKWCEATRRDTSSLLSAIAALLILFRQIFSEESPLSRSPLQQKRARSDDEILWFPFASQSFIDPFPVVRDRGQVWVRDQNIEHNIFSSALKKKQNIEPLEVKMKSVLYFIAWTLWIFSQNEWKLSNSHYLLLFLSPQVLLLHPTIR